MSGFLRQATAGQIRALGPFISSSDYQTPETGLTIANTDVKLVANGGASANKNSGGGTHRVNGVYGFTFDATDSATVGELEVSVIVSGALIVFDKFTVLEEVVYDALFAAAAPGYLQPTSAGNKLDVSAAGNAGIDWANIENPTTAQNLSATNIDVDQVVASVSGAVGSVTGAVGSVTGDIGGLAAGAQSDVRDAVGLAAANLDTQLSALATLITGTATPAQVASAIAAALATTTYAEPTGVPGNTVSIQEKIGRLYQVLIDGLVVDSGAGELQFKNAAGTVLWKKTFTDVASVYTESAKTAP